MERELLTTQARVRRLELRDIEAVVALQRDSPEAAQWTMRDYERVARGDMAGWVVEDEAGVAGFLIARKLIEETEILNLAVRRDARRRGFATTLLGEAVDWTKSVGAASVALEVRASNAGALKFYESQGFCVVGRRPRYYSDPVDEALMMRWVLAEASPARPVRVKE